jgi:hypothetical protein
MARRIPGRGSQGTGYSFLSPGPSGAKAAPRPGAVRRLLPPFTTHAPPPLVGPVNRQERPWEAAPRIMMYTAHIRGLDYTHGKLSKSLLTSKTKSNTL